MRPAHKPAHHPVNSATPGERAQALGSPSFENETKPHAIFIPNQYAVEIGGSICYVIEFDRHRRSPDLLINRKSS